MVDKIYSGLLEIIVQCVIEEGFEGSGGRYLKRHQSERKRENAMLGG